MIVAVLGITGGTGRACAEQALGSGWTVRALARNASAVTLRHDNLTIVEGDVFDADKLGQVIDGVDAVLSALGSNRPTTVFSDGMRAVLAAMSASGCRRVVAVTSRTLLRNDPRAPLLFRRVLQPLLLWRLGPVYADMALMETILRASDVDWTIVRPARLTDGKLTGVYRLATEVMVTGSWLISRANVAHLMVKLVREKLFVRKAVAIAN